MLFGRKFWPLASTVGRLQFTKVEGLKPIILCLPVGICFQPTATCGLPFKRSEVAQSTAHSARYGALMDSGRGNAGLTGSLEKSYNCAARDSASSLLRMTTF